MEEKYKDILLSDDKIMHNSTLTQIKLRLLEHDDSTTRNEYARVLIDVGISKIVCQMVGDCDLEISRSALSILQLISDCPEFYTKDVVRLAIIVVMQKGQDFIRNGNDDYMTMAPILNALGIMLSRVQLHHAIPRSVCDQNSVFNFINKLKLKETNTYLYILTITNLYASAVTMSSKIHRNTDPNVLTENHIKILTAANDTLRMLIRNNDERYENLIVPITIICDAAMRFYDYSGRSRHGGQHSNPMGNLLDPMYIVTQSTMLENVIPNSEFLYLNSNLHSARSRCFANCVCEIYQCEEIDHSEFSWQIAKHGYLMYLHELMIQSETLAEKLSTVIEQIVLNLSHKYLAMDKWTTGLQGFSFYFKKRLIAWRDSASPDDDLPFCDAILFLIYIHFHACDTFRLMDYMRCVVKLNFSRRIMEISVHNIPEIPILQMLLFLFAGSALGKRPEDMDELFPLALARITEIVARVGLENCFAENRKVPIFVLERRSFPNEIPDNILKLWLKYDDNIYVLITPGSPNALVECLLNIRYPDSVGYLGRCPWQTYRMLEQSVNPSVNTVSQIIQSMWTNLPVVLAAHTKTRESSTELYLQMLNDTVLSDAVAMTTLIECAKATIDILLRDNLELPAHLQKMIIAQAVRLLHGAYLARDDRVLRFFVNNYEITKKLQNHALDLTQKDLSAASFACLSAILRSQGLFGVKCVRPTFISHGNILYPSTLDERNHFDMLDFYNQMLMCGVNKPVIELAEMTRDELENTIGDIYGVCCMAHMSSRESDWDGTFHCLTNILRYMAAHSRSTLSRCCDYSCNSQIVNATFKAQFYNFRFFEFARVWLMFSLKCLTPSVRQVLETREDRKRKKRGMFMKSPLLKALYNLKKHVEDAVEDNRIEAEHVHVLRKSISKLL